MIPTGQRTHRVRLVPLTASASRCPSCSSQMLAVGRFALDVEGVGQPCNECLPKMVHPELVDTLNAVESVAARLDRLPAGRAQKIRAMLGEALSADGLPLRVRTHAYRPIPEAPSAPDHAATAI